MTNDNPTLIAGFEDIMVHIRNQEKRIKDLEDELYDLREFKKDAEDTCGSHVVMEDLMKRVKSAEHHEKHTKSLHKQLEERYFLEKGNVRTLTKHIHKLDDVLCNKFNKRLCDDCGEWVDMTDIHEVKDSDYDRIDVCVDCRDQEYTQCDDCMEYYCNTLITDDGWGELCQNCNED